MYSGAGFSPQKRGRRRWYFIGVKKGAELQKIKTQQPKYRFF